jgi:hypothetical protein
MKTAAVVVDLRDFAREVVYTTLARLVEIARALFATGLKQNRRPMAAR